jgi:F-type H+-transporting ATPase subunit delta
MNKNKAHSIARAVFNIAKANKEQGEISAQMRRLLDVFKSEPGLSRFFNSPKITFDKKENLINSIVKSETLREILQFLVKQKKLKLLSGISHLYDYILNNETEFLTADIKTAAPLDAKKKEILINVIKKKFGKNILANFDIDEKLIAGIQAKIGDKVFDNTVKKKLNIIKQGLLQA